MKKHFIDILGYIGVLIAIYVILSKGQASINIINSLFQNGTKAIKVLQGRG